MVIQPRAAYKTESGAGERGSGDTYPSVDLAIFTHELCATAVIISAPVTRLTHKFRVSVRAGSLERARFGFRTPDAVLLTVDSAGTS